MVRLVRISRLSLAGFILSLILSGCGQPPTTPPSPKPPVSGNAQSNPPSPTPVAPTTISDIMISFQAMEMAAMDFRNMEIANTDSTGFIRGVAYAAASSKLSKRRQEFEQLLARTTAADIPQIAQIREAYAPVGSALKAYITVTNVNGVLSGPDARASTLNYGLFVIKAPGFKKTLTRLQSEAGTAATDGNNDLIAADRDLKAAYEKYYALVNAGADAAEVKAAAAEIERAKARLQQLQNH